ncbi:MAG: murein biosynthesis integral membrane protein MurJ [Rhodoferax sp.]
MSLFKSASLVSLLTLASRVTGLVRELLMASVFGASAMTDAFNVAFRIPNLFRRFFAEGSFSQAFVPVLAASLASDGPERTRRIVDQVATIMVWVLLALSVLGVLGASGLVWLMASGLAQDPKTLDTAAVLTRWMFPYIAFMSLVALASGVLNTWKRFAVPAVTPVLLNVCMIASAALGAPWMARQGLEPIYAMAGGVLAGGALQLGLQWFALHRLGLRPHVAWRWSALRQAWQDAATKKILALMGPTLLGVGVAHLSMLINTQIASHLRPGSVSWISYADRLMEFPTALLGVALGVVLMPQLAAARARNDPARYSELMDWGLRLVVLLALPCAAALLVFAIPLVAVLYHYGAMRAVDVQQVSFALMGWGVGLLGLIALKVLAPGYYANQDTRTPVKIALGVLLVTQALNALLVPVLAHAALTLSIGLGALVNAAWLLRGLLRRGLYQPMPGWPRFLAQTGLATLVMAGFLAWAHGHWDWIALQSRIFERILTLIGVLIAAAALYFITCAAVRVPLKSLVRR